MTKKGDTSSTKKKSTINKKKIVVKKKKSAKKKATTRRIIIKNVITKEERGLERLLIENFISMQKVMSTLAVKFDHLSKRTESLLSLFEDSAKSVAEKEINLELKGDVDHQKEVMEKLKLLLDQNKLIAKGITLVHESSAQSDTSIDNNKGTQGFKVNPSTMEDDENIPDAPSPDTFTPSRINPIETPVKSMEGEGLPPSPLNSL